jgi:hypothetical protein
MSRLGLPILLILATAAARAAEPPVDFVRDVRPILSNNCFFCHGPDEGERQGGRLVNTIVERIPAVSQEDTWKWWNK